MHLILHSYSENMSFSFSRTLVHAFNRIGMNRDAHWKLSMGENAYLSYSRGPVWLYSLITFLMRLWSVLLQSSNYDFPKLPPQVASKGLMTKPEGTLMSHLVLMTRWWSISYEMLVSVHFIMDGMHHFQQDLHHIKSHPRDNEEGEKGFGSRIVRSMCYPCL